MKTTGKEKNSWRGLFFNVSIRWKLAAYMALFVAIVLIITWLFQVFLLDTFFRSIKESEMEESARLLAQNVGDAGLENDAFREAVDHSLCVVVYQLNEQSGKPIVSIDATGSNVALSISEKRLREFYRRAYENGGSCSAEITFGGVEVDSKPFFDKLPFSPEENGTPTKVPSKNVRLLHVRLAEDDAGEQYMIVLDASIQPMDSTVRTLVKQYAWIAAIILMVAAITVLILYQKISEPIVQMNESAKQLALGKYDVEFSGKGYLETYELAEALNYASNELSKLDRLQKELIANISHDLRTPLTLIQGYGEIMRDLPGENTPENMQVLIDETARLSALVNDLLDLSRIQSGARVPQEVVFDLTDAVREVWTRYDALIKHKGYHLEFSSNGSVPVCADRSMILQVIYNLINNAINYTGDDQFVLVKQSIENGIVRISISDTGEGIQKEDLPLIWDRYYKVDKVHRRAMIGTGLGLSIVKEILEKHHANYGVESVLGEGSTFWFELPVAQYNEQNHKEN
jgi:signal transduction histidine kinase